MATLDKVPLLFPLSIKLLMKTIFSLSFSLIDSKAKEFETSRLSIANLLLFITSNLVWMSFNDRDGIKNESFELGDWKTKVLVVKFNGINGEFDWEILRSWLYPIILMRMLSDCRISSNIDIDIEELISLWIFNIFWSSVWISPST